MPPGKPRNWFNITPQTLQPHAHPGTCGVYGSRYMSGRHEEMSNARDCQDDASFTYASPIPALQPALQYGNHTYGSTGH